MSFLRILPFGLRGRLGTKSTLFGAWTLLKRSLQSLMSLPASTTCPGLSSTTALTASPNFGSGTPITAQSWTAGWDQITCSTSLG